MPAFEAVREVLRPRVFPAQGSPAAEAAARAVREQGGPSVRAIIFFGSRKTQARPGVHSAWDLFVVTESYPEFYRSLHAAGALRRSPALAAGLNAVMPPNSVSLCAPDPGGGEPLHLKCAVLSRAAFRRETSQRRHDHFLLGRLFQPAEVLHAAHGEAAEEALVGLARACLLTYSWSRPWLPARFDVGEYCRTLLRVSFGAEIRPEPAERVEALWQAQQHALRPVYARLLEALREEGELLEPEPGLYALARPATRLERLRLSAYFRLSLLRATARWFKYILTFEDWLEFLVRKAERHTGQRIELRPRERRLPLLFLWPRVVRYLRHKDAGGPPP